MQEPRLIAGARALLFERLVDQQPHQREEAQPFRVLTRAALRESVRREVERLLNTRCPFPDGFLPGERTVIDYGLADFSALSPASEPDRRLLAQELTRAIEAYEPRLQHVRVLIEPDPQNGNRGIGRIQAQLVVGRFQEPVSFPLLIRPREGIAELPGKESR